MGSKKVYTEKDLELNLLNYSNKVKLLQETFMREVVSVIDGNIEITNKVDFISVNKVIELLGKIGYEVESCIQESNGWKWDFYGTYKIKNKKYMINAEGYYGGLTFSNEE